MGSGRDCRAHMVVDFRRGVQAGPGQSAETRSGAQIRGRLARADLDDAVDGLVADDEPLVRDDG